ncbi:sugar phosphate isomerase/epimerase family protein [Microbacterium yannicii]|uniref:sugar phosphate isomerase/epimerase family protein n=1 Tax=Microbacterium yannicii TaxID=671622 RepID=UPI0002DA5174|nr:sugar phosphate isomerase/epimerase family protein [Microbacterium yannicii]
MKLALDPLPFRHLPIPEMVRTVADLGYEWIEFSQRDDFFPFYRHPRASDELVQELKKSLKDTGVKIASVLPILRWSSPDEDERQAAVRSWLRSIDITVELGVDQMNSEFSGRPEQSERSEAQWLRSMEVILPRLEKEGIKLNIEPHPDDFIEDGIEAVRMIRGMNSPLLGFLYCVPHTFYQGHDISHIVEYAGKDLKHLHLADSFDYRASGGRRYLLNPAETTATVHQHLPYGQGEVDLDSFFAALKRVGFDGIATVAVFSQEEKAIENSTWMREETLRRLA